jgi:hypothetical protein
MDPPLEAEKAPNGASQKGASASRSRECKPDEVRLDAGPAGVAASRDDGGLVGHPVCKRKHLDLRSVKHLAL